MTHTSFNLSVLAGMHRALGNAARFRVAHLVALKPLSVTDIQSILSLPQPVVSKHLAYLNIAGLVECHRSGKRVFYSVPKNPSPELALVVGHLKRSGLGIAELRRDAEALARATVASFPGRSMSRQTQRRHEEENMKYMEYKSDAAPGLVGTDDFID